MQSHCSQCGKDFTEKVGMGLLEGVVAIKLKNKFGNYCPECMSQLKTTKQGRKQLRKLYFKVLLYCGAIFGGVTLVFALVFLIIFLSL